MYSPWKEYPFGRCIRAFSTLREESRDGKERNDPCVYYRKCVGSQRWWRHIETHMLSVMFFVDKQYQIRVWPPNFDRWSHTHNTHTQRPLHQVRKWCVARTVSGNKKITEFWYRSTVARDMWPSEGRVVTQRSENVSVAIEFSASFQFFKITQRA